MNPPHHPERTILDEALHIADLPRRDAYIDQACGSDAELRRRVVELIAAHEAAGRFLVGASDASPPRDTALDISDLDQPGDIIGRYKLLQKIGEGGCGIVYMADQEEPVRRRVALKVLKPGMDTKSVLARFEAERQALALMDHPHVAKVLDAGSTSTGRPFFVMELVKGTRITEYCDQHLLPTSDRLRLFNKVCFAIHHAHQKGIIHRDIKPSNILVTHFDGVPTPIVIDFGIAKATQQPLTDKTLFTAFDQFIGTPAYMSPEQAELSALDIDTRSDIYSLGVLLYELLAGRTPFEAKVLIQAGLEEIRRVIREEEPERPSTRISTMIAADQTEIARNRQQDPANLLRLLHGDLDCVVMKALEKDRSQRYGSAEGFAEDVQRFLSDEPVQARPPSRLYRLRKAIRRNRVGFAAALGVTVTLLCVLVFLMVKVVPILVEHADVRGRNLPVLVQFVVETSRFLSHWFLYILILTGGSGYVWWKLRAKTKLRPARNE